MQKIPKREYTPEFRELAIKRVKTGQSIDAVAKEFGVNIKACVTGSRLQRQANLSVRAARSLRQNRWNSPLASREHTAETGELNNKKSSGVLRERLTVKFA